MKEMANLPPPGTGLPDHNRGPELLVACGSLTGIAFIFVVVRFYARIRITKSVSWDDYFCLSAWASYYLHECSLGKAANTVCKDCSIHRDNDNDSNGSLWRRASPRFHRSTFKHLPGPQVQLSHTTSVRYVYWPREDEHWNLLIEVEASGSFLSDYQIYSRPDMGSIPDPNKYVPSTGG